MSSVYEHYLPLAFPYRLEAHKDTVDDLVRQLISWTRSDTPVGSSFAVTVERAPERTYLWLSRVSADFIRKYLVDDIIVSTVETRE